MKRIYWHLSDYISHRRAGLAYCRCLKLAGLEPVSRLEDADLAVLHDDPLFWPAIFSAHPRLQEIPVVGYAVWEGQILPEVYRPGLALVQEVWTASSFSAAALEQGHSRVRVLPHVVAPAQPTDEDIAWAAATCSATPYFFTVMDTINPRKNLSALLRVFTQVRLVSGKDVRLVIKQYRKELNLDGLAGVLAVGGEISDGRLAALYQNALAYISPHRGEAWGLGLSEAMSHGLPVLATGWSGNMDFMDNRNAVPLHYRLEPVGERMVGMLPHFQPDMLWAAVDEKHLEREMLRLIRRGPDQIMCQRARAVTERFAPSKVGARLKRLIEEITY